MFSQEEYERLVGAMADKGVPHWAFESLADLRKSERIAHTEVEAIRFTIVQTMKLGEITDFEGLPCSNINWLQCLRKILIDRGVNIHG